MRRTMRWLVMALTLVFSVCAFAQTADMKALVEELQQGGYVIVFRHGAKGLLANLGKQGRFDWRKS